MDHKYTSDACDASRDDGADDQRAEGAGDGRAAVTTKSLARRPVSVRLTDQELRSIAAAATACGQAPSVFLRSVVLSAAGRPLPRVAAKRDALAQETAKAVGELGRIGSLLNQVARVANAKGRLGPADADYAYQRVARELAAVRVALLDQDEHRRAP